MVLKNTNLWLKYIFPAANYNQAWRIYFFNLSTEMWLKAIETREVIKIAVCHFVNLIEDNLITSMETSPQQQQQQPSSVLSGTWPINEWMRHAAHLFHASTLHLLHRHDKCKHAFTNTANHISSRAGSQAFFIYDQTQTGGPFSEYVAPSITV